MQYYSIKEASKLCGLPESTLRYYETTGLIDFVQRDKSSGHRVYSDQNIEIISAISCMNATGMSIDEMKQYLGDLKEKKSTHPVQLELLRKQELRILEEEELLKLRKKYIKGKIEYWTALDSGDSEKITRIQSELKELSEKLRFGEKSFKKNGKK